VAPAKPPDEFTLIARYFRPLTAGSPGALDLSDDAALLDVPAGQRLVITADALVAGVHFFAEDAPDLIARKMLRVNLSDLAAMAARPLGYVMTCAFPQTITESWLAGFAAGLARDQMEFDVKLLGGDTVATPGPLTLSVTAFGSVEAGKELRRSGAAAGDLIAVSGTIGDSALGLRRIQGKIGPFYGDEELIERYLLPRPRLALARQLVGLASAAMDVSDGLVADLSHICEASKLSAVIEAANVPLSKPARRLLAEDPTHLTTILTGGEDYELLFTIPRERHAELARLPVTVIGRMEAGQREDGWGTKVIDDAGHKIETGKGGFRHF
jgi:thiamine-monophosphate kinase